MGKPKISKFFTRAPRAKQASNLDKKSQTRSGRKASVTKDVDVDSRSQVDPSVDGRGSEVWDIELDKSLPSDDKSLSDQVQEAQNIILKTHFNKLAVENPPGINLNDEMQLPSREFSLQETSSAIHEQSNVLKHCKPSSIAPSHSASQQLNAPPPYDRDIKSVIPENECILVPHTPPTFRFRPLRNTNHRFIFPVTQAPEPLVPLCDNMGDEGSSQVLPDMMLDPEAIDDEPNSNEAWNIGIHDLDHPDQDQDSHMIMDVYLDDHAPDDDGYYWYQDENNQELGLSHEHYDMDERTIDLIDQHNLEVFEDDWENGDDWDGQDIILFEEPDCPGSLNTEEWTTISADNDSGNLGLDAHTSDCVEDWSDLDDPGAESVCESTSYAQEARGVDPTQTAFIQGRSLLFGIEEPIAHKDGENLWGIESAEHEVTTRLLKGHWLPQKL